MCIWQFVLHNCITIYRTKNIKFFKNTFVFLHCTCCLPLHFQTNDSVISILNPCFYVYSCQAFFDTFLTTLWSYWYPSGFPVLLGHVLASLYCFSLFIFKCVCKIVKSDYYLYHVCRSVCVKQLAPTGWIFMKFYIWVFFKNLWSVKFKFFEIWHW